MKVKRTSKTRSILTKTVLQTRSAAAAGARTAHTVMRRLVRVDTSELKNSITENPVNQNKTIVEVGAEHGIPNEFGTTKMTAQPFFRPGVDSGRREMRQKLKVKT